MLKPVNGHLLIDPLKHESFMSSEKGIYEEIGTIVAFPIVFNPFWVTTRDINKDMEVISLKVGDKVYFDSWLAAKFPKNDKEFFWLVKWEDVRAIDDE